LSAGVPFSAAPISNGAVELYFLLLQSQGEKVGQTLRERLIHRDPEKSARKRIMRAANRANRQRKSAAKASHADAQKNQTTTNAPASSWLAAFEPLPMKMAPVIPSLASLTRSSRPVNTAMSRRTCLPPEEDSVPFLSSLSNQRSAKNVVTPTSGGLLSLLQEQYTTNPVPRPHQLSCSSTQYSCLEAFTATNIHAPSLTCTSLTGTPSSQEQDWLVALAPLFAKAARKTKTKLPA